jgi:hypothetical protein
MLGRRGLELVFGGDDDRRRFGRRRLRRFFR